MKFLLCALLLLTALAGARPLFGQAGIPNPWELISIVLSGFLDADSVDTDHLVVNVNIDADAVADSAAADGTVHFDFTAVATADPAANAEVHAGLFTYNVNGGSNGVFTVNGLEGVVRSRFEDEAMTARGVHGRIYIDPDSSATLRTGIGGEFSARASYSGGTAIAAENGTAFVGARIYMAPYFSGGTVGNLDNFWGVWIFGEHASQRNADAAICIEDAGGGWTYGVDMVDALISTAEIRGQNAETIDNAVDGTWDFNAANILTTGDVSGEDGRFSDSLWVRSDTAGYQVGDSTAGDQDVAIITIHESDNTETVIYNDGSSLIQFSSSILSDIDVQAGVQFRVGSLRMRDDSILTTGTADLYVEPGASGAAGVLFGTSGHGDYIKLVDAEFHTTSTSYDSTATLAAGVYFCILDTAAGQDTLNLPAAASHTGRLLIIKAVNANGAHVDANSTELIDNDQVVNLAQWDSISLFCDGSRWLIH